MKLQRPCFNLLIGAVVLLATSTFSSAFTPHHRNKSHTTTTTSYTKLNNSDNENDPTNNIPTSIANSIQNIFTNFNPLNDAKKKLVQSLAGDYDKTKIQNELQSLIENEPLLMLSFTK